MGILLGEKPIHNQTGSEMDRRVGGKQIGGFCQGALSYDDGSTWMVVKDVMGDCPRVRPGRFTNQI
jgi:hypothetical protein